MPKRIRIKYCGGCNPRYDRTSITTKLRADFPEAVVAETAGDGPDRFVAVICGCPAACALHGELNGRAGKAIMTSEKEYEQLAAAVRASLDPDKERER
jgi:4-hydroxybutyrate CoA-transferase